MDGTDSRDQRPQAESTASGRPRSVRRMAGSAFAILLGLLTITILTPLSQFLTIGLVNSDLETATPVGWALGLVVSLVLVAAVCRLFAAFRLVSRKTLVILYCMLTIAVPVMNMGLARILVLALVTVQEHYLSMSVNTYRTAYQAQDPRWVPVAPSDEGFAWNRADRVLSLLRDHKARKARESAGRTLMGLIHDAVARPAAEDSELRDRISTLTGQLGVNEAEAALASLRAAADADALFKARAEALGVRELLTAHLAAARVESAAAAERLQGALADVDEQALNYVPAVIEAWSVVDRTRLEADRARLSEAERADLDARTQALIPRFEELRADVSMLSRIDLEQVRTSRARLYDAQHALLSPDELAAQRTAFIYRSGSSERKAMYGQDGRHGTPNQNLLGMRRTLWVDAESRRAMAEATFLQKWVGAAKGLPWGLWRGPLLRWGGMLLCLFLFLMCLSEWLRRKWVERENLAFPLVEVVDAVIRHDYALEYSEDICTPIRRKRLFAPVFWVGVAISVIILCAEALAHYGIASGGSPVGFNVSRHIFTSGFFRNVDFFYLALSPIAVGLLFLVSLEVSFSVWSIYLIYRIGYAILKVAYMTSTGTELRDRLYTGWAGGTLLPFNGEQLLGASLCFAAIALYRTASTLRSHRSATPASPGGTYVPRRLASAGLVLMPLAMGWMLWDLGLRNLPVIVGMGLVSLLLAVASARVRAETGLPQGHSTYDFTKLPIVLGLTGWMGAKVYTVFISVAFLPVTLLSRLLPQQLENIELARRNRVSYGTIAVGSLLAFVLAVTVGVPSFLVMCYLRGESAWGQDSTFGMPLTTITAYPLWVSHFLGEAGLELFTEMHGIRLLFIFLGVATVGVITLCRQRFMKFPLHPTGYMLILFSTFFPWISPYIKNPDTASAKQGVEASWLWGSALVAWLLKKLILKYGGMNIYRRVKPLFVGLVVGAVMTVFAWNVVDLVISIQNEGRPEGEAPPAFAKPFVDSRAFSPKSY